MIRKMPTMPSMQCRRVQGRLFPHGDNRPKGRALSGWLAVRLAGWQDAGTDKSVPSSNGSTPKRRPRDTRDDMISRSSLDERRIIRLSTMRSKDTKPSRVSQ